MIRRVVHRVDDCFLINQIQIIRIDGSRTTDEILGLAWIALLRVIESKASHRVRVSRIDAEFFVRKIDGLRIRCDGPVALIGPAVGVGEIRGLFFVVGL